MCDYEEHDYSGFYKDTKINKYTGTICNVSGYDVNHCNKFVILLQIS